MEGKAKDDALQRTGSLTESIRLYLRKDAHGGERTGVIYFLGGCSMPGQLYLHNPQPNAPAFTFLTNQNSVIADAA